MDVEDTLKSYLSTAEQFFLPFYINTMKHDRFLHILRLIHFSDSMNQSDKNGNKCDTLENDNSLIISVTLKLNFTLRLNILLQMKLLCYIQRESDF
jgi:hypothetical protein